MMKVSDEMMKKKELRKPEGTRSVSMDFQDLEIRRKETRGLLSSDVNNCLIQDRSVKIQVGGSKVKALYP